MEEIRALRPEDIDESIALSEFAFQYQVPKHELEEARKDVKPEQIYACYVDGKLAAKLHLLPFTVYAGGGRFSMGGVAGVATWPEYRRGGRVAKLLHHALSVMKESGQVVSLLAPFSFEFYRRYGWEHCIDRKQYTLTRAEWPKFAEPDGVIYRSDDARDLFPIYEEFAIRYSGMLQRTEEWWNRKVKRWGNAIRAVYQSTTAKPEGYIVYQVKNSEITIHEFVHLTEAARRGLWNFICNHDSMANQATIIVPTDDPLPFLLQNPRVKQEVIPYFMARIVDVEDFLKQFPFMGASSGTRVRVQVTDPHAPWNEGTFQIGVSETRDKEISVERVAEPDSEPRIHELVSMDIQTLTAMMFGYQRPGMLRELGRISGSPEAVSVLEQIVPAHKPFLYDFF